MEKIIKVGSSITIEYDVVERNCYSDRFTIQGRGELSTSTSLHPLENSTLDIYHGITALKSGCTKFFHGAKFSSLVLGRALKELGDKVFQGFGFDHNIVLPESLTILGQSCFADTKITGFFIPGLLTTVPINNFFGCARLKSIEVSKDNPSYSSKDGILYNKDFTEMIYVPEGYNEKICIPNTVRKIGAFCFKNNQNRTQLIIPSNVERIEDYAFIGSLFEHIKISNHNALIGKGCFMDCSQLKTVSLPTKLNSYPESLFQNSGIVQIDCNDIVSSLGASCFEDCCQLKQIRLPKSLSYLPDRCFKSCCSLASLVLPSAVRKIEETCFEGCLNLSEVKFMSQAPFRIDAKTWASVSDSMTLYVPEISVVAFQSADYWNEIHHIAPVNIDRAEEDNLTVLEELVGSLSYGSQNHDSQYITSILKNMVDSLGLTIGSEDAYEKSLQILKYCIRFNPAALPDVTEGILCKCEYRYKLKLYKDAMTSLNIVIGHEGVLSTPADKCLPVIIDSKLFENTDKKSKEHLSAKVYFDAIQDIVIDNLRKATASVKIAVSWFTNYDIFSTIKTIVGKGVQVELVTNNDLINNGGYCLDFQELIDLGVRIHLAEFPQKLVHHKFCIIDGKILINGSYNWTNSSSLNEENVMVIEDDYEVISRFEEEFSKLCATYALIDKMPETATDRPQYDRSAFKQYITAELCEQARTETSPSEKIRLLTNAKAVNQEYLNCLNSNYTEEIKLAEIEKSIIDEASAKVVSDTSSNDDNSIHLQDNANPLKMQELKKIESIRKEMGFDDYCLGLDISSSMKNYYSTGHIWNVLKTAVPVSFIFSKRRGVDVWTYSDKAEYVGLFDETNITELSKIQATKGSTHLKTFIQKVKETTSNSLVLVVTDGEDADIEEVAKLISSSRDIYWQILGIGNNFKKLENALSSVSNSSVITCNDLTKLSEEGVNSLLLGNYMEWRSKNCLNMNVYM